MGDLDGRFARYRRLLDAGFDALVEAAGTAAAPRMYGMMSYHLGRLDADLRPVESCNGNGRPGGKALRAALCFLACEAVGGSAPAALPGALAVELLHNFSLVHDDIQDGSAVRRHRAAVWRVWGVPQAINVGDGLFALAHLALASGAMDDSRRARAGQLFGRTCLELCEGQYLDLSADLTGGGPADLDGYLLMAGRKTAALFGCAAELGALLGPAGTPSAGTHSAGPPSAGRFGEFGRALGVAFQALDDIVGVWGDERELGKPASDIRDRKLGLPAVLACARSAAPDRARLTDLYLAPAAARASADDEWIRDLFDRLDIRREATAIAAGYAERARRLLEAIPNASTGALIALTRSLTEQRSRAR
jgi:geranylgeranyl diphosphate synthase, type I